MIVSKDEQSCSQQRLVALLLVGGIKLLRLSQVTIHHNHLLRARLIISIFIVIKIIPTIIHVIIIIITHLFLGFPASYSYFPSVFRHHILSKSKPKSQVVEQMFRATTRTISGLNISIVWLVFLPQIAGWFFDIRNLFMKQALMWIRKVNRLSSKILVNILHHPLHCIFPYFLLGLTNGHCKHLRVNYSSKLLVATPLPPQKMLLEVVIAVMVIILEHLPKIKWWCF